MTYSNPLSHSEYPEPSQANKALIFSILGFCGPLALIGLVMGWQEISAIREERRTPENTRIAWTAIGVGIAWLIILVVAAILYLGT